MDKHSPAIGLWDMHYGRGTDDVEIPIRKWELVDDTWRHVISDFGLGG